MIPLVPKSNFLSLSSLQYVSASILNHFDVINSKGAESGKISQMKTVVTPFKVIQGYRFWYQFESPYATSYSNLQLHPVSHRFRGMADYRSVFSIDRGLLVCNALVLDEPPELNTIKFNAKKLETSLYRTVQEVCRYLEPYWRDA